MAIDEIFARTVSKWMDGTGPVANIVLSSRVRLARNLGTLPLPHLAGEEPAEKVLDLVRAAVEKLNGQAVTEPLHFVLLRDLSALERQVLVEKHLISPALAMEKKPSAVALSTDGAVSIMVNEEDHLRIQCLQSGLQPEEAWRVASRIDDGLETEIDFAFDPEFGYLTACPTNVGTGLRASVMLHLPALVMLGQAGRIFATIGQLGLAVRGLYGEGTEATGNIFQVSNQITLGHTEDEIIKKLIAVTRQIVEQEYAARSALFQDSRQKLEDRIFRSYGILTNARLLPPEEAMQLLSDVRLGVDLNLIPGAGVQSLNELLVLTRPAYLQVSTGTNLSASERDSKRAQLVRRQLAGNKKA